MPGVEVHIEQQCLSNIHHQFQVSQYKKEKKLGNFFFYHANTQSLAVHIWPSKY